MKKRARIVVLRKANPMGCFPDLEANKGYILLKSFWRNEEGWYRIRDEATGKVHEVPDIFFEAVWSNAV